VRRGEIRDSALDDEIKAALNEGICAGAEKALVKKATGPARILAASINPFLGAPSEGGLLEVRPFLFISILFNFVNCFILSTISFCQLLFAVNFCIMSILLMPSTLMLPSTLSGND